MAKELLSYIFALSLGLGACGPVRMDKGEIISPSDLSVVTKSANNGDLKAVKRLIENYEHTDGMEIEAAKWRERARSLGDPEELHFYAAGLFTSAKREPDVNKRRLMMIEAQRSAVKSYSISGEASTQDLINKINLELLSS